MESLLSIIVPCYNTGKYIKRCLNSILSQDYKNIEVIVVDDGSVDDTGSMVKTIASLDSRVKYIYKDNSGVSDTRNKGISYSRGEYLTFVDSDDTIEHDLYTSLISMLIDYDADIAHSSYSRVYENVKNNISGNGNIYVMNRKDSIDKLLNGGLFTGSVWNKVYKKEIVENIRFNEKYKINEDVLYNLYAFLNSKKIVYYDKCLYNYFTSETSSCVSTNTIKKSEDVYQVSLQMHKECAKNRLSDVSYNRVAGSRIGLYRAYKFFGNKNQKKLARELRKQIIDDYNSKLLLGTQKYNGMIIKYFYFLYKPFYCVYNRIRKPNWDI